MGDHNVVFERIQQSLQAALALSAACLLGIAACARAGGIVCFGFQVPAWGVAAAAVLLIAAGRTRLALRVKLSLTVAAVLGTIAFALALKPPYSPLVVRLVESLPTAPPITYYDSDDQRGHTLRSSMYADAALGNRATPGSVWHEAHQADYRAVYHIDADGWRRSPDDRPRVIFSGCSMTFGAGVADEETFVANVTRRLGSGYRVVNASQSGWGTAQALLACEGLLEEASPTALVVYCWIADHLSRNYKNIRWHGQIDPRGRFPLFDLVDGKLVLLGLMEHGACREPDNEKTEARAIAITQAMLGRLHQACAAKSARLVVAILPNPFNSPMRDPIADWLPESELEVVDLRDARPDFFTSDAHPTAAGHATIAEALWARAALGDLNR